MHLIRCTPARSIVPWRCVPVFMILSLASVCAAGDEAAPVSLSPGMRVRVLAPDVLAGRVAGTIEQVSSDSMTIGVPGRTAPVSVSRDKILRLDVSDGPRSRGIDALIGAGIGAGVGAAGGALSSSGGRGHIVSGGAVAGVCALLGAGVGALIGVAIPPGERWSNMSPSRYRVSFAPRLDHGLEVAAAWHF